MVKLVLTIVSWRRNLSLQVWPTLSFQCQSDTWDEGSVASVADSMDGLGLWTSIEVTQKSAPERGQELTLPGEQGKPMTEGTRYFWPPEYPLWDSDTRGSQSQRRDGRFSSQGQAGFETQQTVVTGFCRLHLKFLYQWTPVSNLLDTICWQKSIAIVECAKYCSNENWHLKKYFDFLFKLSTKEVNNSY